MKEIARQPQNVGPEKAELEAILSSKLFTRAPSIAKLLSYLCRKYFDGEADQIKEYTIAVELYERSPDFHSKEDPIVRVEATRLRTRLKEYYQSEGKDHPVQITVPLGQYTPSFQCGQTIKPSEVSKEAAVARDEPKNEVPVPKDGGTPPPANGLPHGGIAAEPELAPTSSPERVPPRPRVISVAVLSFLGLALLIVGGIWVYRLSHRGNLAPAATAPSAGAPEAVLALPEGPELRIMAGSNLERYVDRVGKVWESDRFYKGGEILAASQAALQRAEDSHLLRSARGGDFDYVIPLKPGIYELHLYFGEMQYGFEPEEGGETSRIFNVQANDRLLLEAFDVFSDAGGGGKIDEKVFTDISPAQDGLLHLSFRSGKDKALVNGLEILPGIRGRMRPIRITTRTSPYLSQDQLLWEPDRFFHGGRSVVRLNPVQVAKDAELYQGERYGNFSYSIPVAPGRYRMTLKFAETYFGPSHPQHVGPEKRFFDVYCNGRTLLKEFNIAREAGGLNRAIDKVFDKLQPNAQGKLELSFVPVMNYACVNAIEVVPEVSTR